MVSGNALDPPRAGTATSSTSATRSTSPENFKFQTCKEGIPVGTDCMAIPVNAEHPGTALLFIDWILDPENAVAEHRVHRLPDAVSRAPSEAFAELVKDDPAIDVTVDDLENGAAVRELSGVEGQRPGTDVWTEVKALNDEERLRAPLPGPGRRCGCSLFFAVPFGIVLAISFGTTDDLGGVIYGWHPRELRATRFDPLFVAGPAALGRLRARDRRAVPR